MTSLSSWQLQRANCFALALIAAASLQCKRPSNNSDSLNESVGQETPPSHAPLLDIETRNNEAMLKKLALIDSAKKSIDLAYYIFADDSVGKLFAIKLSEAAQRGVHIRFLMDGSPQFLNRPFFRALIASHPQNIEFAYFRPFNLPAAYKAMTEQFKPLEAFITTLLSLEGGVNQSNILKVLNQAPAALRGVLASAWGSAYTLKNFETPTSTYDSNASQTMMRAYAAAMAKQAGVKLSVTDLAELTQYIGNRLKRLHHKLLLVDEQFMVTGGRNLWADSHLEFDQGELARSAKFAPTLDSDIFINDRDISRQAKLGFESYWQCLSNSNCPAGIDLEKEAPVADSLNYWRATVLPGALNVETLKTNNRWFNPINDFHFETSDAKLRYVENSMHRQPGKAGYLNEVPNGILKEFQDRLKAAGPQDRILIKAAYMILPPAIYDALIGAIGRGADVTLLTDSPYGSNHVVVPFFGRLQFLPLLQRAKELGGKLHIYEYNHPQLIHDKVWIFNDVIYVGSSNADPRSFYLNTENGIVIEPTGRDITYAGKSFRSVAAAYADWQLQQIATLQKRSWANTKTGKILPYIEEITTGKLLAEELEPSLFSISERPQFEAITMLKDAFKRSIILGPNRLMYQNYLYFYLLLQL